MKEEFKERNERQLGIKLKIVKSGNSNVFNEWNKYCGITEDEFINALEWLADDPRTPLGNPTREIGVVPTDDGRNKIYGDKFPHKKSMFPYDENKIKTEIKKLEMTYTTKYDDEGNAHEEYWGSFDIDTGMRSGIHFVINIESRV